MTTHSLRPSAYMPLESSIVFSFSKPSWPEKLRLATPPGRKGGNLCAEGKRSTTAGTLKDPRMSARSTFQKSESNSSRPRSACPLRELRSSSISDSPREASRSLSSMTSTPRWSPPRISDRGKCLSNVRRVNEPVVTRRTKPNRIWKEPRRLPALIIRRPETLRRPLV